MLFTEIPIPIFSVFVLQILLLPIQVANSFLKGKDKSHVWILLLSLTYLAFNAFWILLDNSNVWFYEAVMSFLTVAVLSFTTYFFITKNGITAKQFKLTKKIGILIILFFAHNLASVLFINSIYYSEWMFVIGCEILGVHTIMVLSKIKNDQNDELKLFSPIVVVVFSIALLLPILLQVINEKSVQCILINLIFFILSFQYMKDYFVQSSLGNVNLSSHSQLEPAIFKEFTFTERQKEICLLLLEGMDLKQIPGVLPISYDTVRSHLNNIYSKTGINGLTALKKELARLD